MDKRLIDLKNKIDEALDITKDIANGLGDPGFFRRGTPLQRNLSEIRRHLYYSKELINNREELKNEDT